VDIHTAKNGRWGVFAIRKDLAYGALYMVGPKTPAHSKKINQGDEISPITANKILMRSFATSANEKFIALGGSLDDGRVHHVQIVDTSNPKSPSLYQLEMPPGDKGKRRDPFTVKGISDDGQWLLGTFSKIDRDVGALWRLDPSQKSENPLLKPFQTFGPIRGKSKNLELILTGENQGALTLRKAPTYEGIEMITNRDLLKHVEQVLRSDPRDPLQGEALELKVLDLEVSPNHQWLSARGMLNEMINWNTRKKGSVPTQRERSFFVRWDLSHPTELPNVFSWKDGFLVGQTNAQFITNEGKILLASADNQYLTLSAPDILNKDFRIPYRSQRPHSNDDGRVYRILFSESGTSIGVVSGYGTVLFDFSNLISARGNTPPEILTVKLLPAAD